MWKKEKKRKESEREREKEREKVEDKDWKRDLRLLKVLLECPPN